MRDQVSRIAEAIHEKIMAEDVEPTAEESPCKTCPLEGCCERVQCSVKETSKR